MKLTDKAYRFKYDSQTGLFSGLTRDAQEKDATPLEPIFDNRYRTCFDTTLNQWKLVTREDYWAGLSRQDQIKNYESEITPIMQDAFKMILEKLDDHIDRQNQIKKMLLDMSESNLRTTTHLQKVLTDKIDMQYTGILSKLETNLSLTRNTIAIYDDQNHLRQANFQSLVFARLKPWYQRLWQFFLS